ncbi:MAG: tetratricopeptide repeat protein, partial [Thermoanaerobaculia bacterium]
YLAQGRQKEAEPYLRQAERHQQRNPFHHYRMGLQRVAVGDYESAVSHLKEAIRRDSGTPSFHATLADVYVEIGDREKALNSFRKAIRSTEDPEAKADLEHRRDALLADG